MKPIETRDFSELHQMLETGYFVHRYIDKPEAKSYHKIYKAGKDDYVIAAIDKATGQELEHSIWHYKSLSNLFYQHHISWVLGKSWLWVEVKPESFAQGTCPNCGHDWTAHSAWIRNPGDKTCETFDPAILDERNPFHVPESGASHEPA